MNNSNRIIFKMLQHLNTFLMPTTFSFTNIDWNFICIIQMDTMEGSNLSDAIEMTALLSDDKKNIDPNDANDK